MTKTELLTAWLLTYALHSTLLLGLAFAVTRRLIQAHELRELVWKTALLGGLLSASLQTFSGVEPLGGRFAIQRPTAPASLPTTVAATPAPRVDASVPDGPSRKAAPRPEATKHEPSGVRRDAAPPSPGGPSTSTALLAAWALLATLLAFQLLGSQLLLLVRVGRRALVRDPELLELLDLLREEAGLSRPVRLTRAEGLASPVALGLSEICIPDAALTELDRAQQESMLAHELAHLSRRDPLWLLAACLLERVLFFQPLNRIARRGLQESAEFLCDDWAVRRAGSGLTLATCLVKVAEWLDTTRGEVPVSGMAELRSQFVARIDRLVGNHALAARPARRWLVPVAVVAVVGLVVAAPGVTARDSRSLVDQEGSAEKTELGTTPEPAREVQEDQPAVAAGTDTVTPALVAALADPEAEVRRAAARSLGSRKDPRAISGLVAAMKDSDVEVRRAAVRAIAEVGSARSVEPLLHALEDVDAEVRQAALSALSEVDDARVVRPAMKLLSDVSADVRQAAAQVLGERKATVAAEALTAALKDPSADVRQAAASALGELQLSTAPVALLEALRDASADVRRAAASAAGEIHDARAVPGLAALLRDPSPDVREAAVSALGEVRDAAARDERTPRSPGGAGGGAPPPNDAATKALEGALKSEDRNVRRHAAEALGDRS